MKTRVFFLYVIFALLIVTLIGALLWPFLQVDERLRDLLIQQVDPSFGGTVELRQLHLGFGSLSLNGLEVREKDELWSLQVDRALIRFSLWKYLLSGFKIQNSITALDLQSPSFNLRLSPGDSASARPSLGWNLVESAPEILWGKKLSLNAGDLRLFTNSGQHLFSLPNISLLLDSQEKGSLDVHVQSSGPGEQNLNCELWLSISRSLRTADGRMVLSADSLRYQPTANTKNPLLVCAKGLQSDLRWSARGDDSRLDGTIQMQQSQLDVGDRRLIQFDSLACLVDNWNLRMISGEGSGLASKWALTGQIADLRRPGLDFLLSARSQDCSDLRDWVGQGAPLSPSGALSLDARIQGSLASPTASLDAHLEKIQTKLTDWRRIEVKANYAGRHLTLTHIGALTDQGDLAMSGQVDLHEKPSIDGNFIFKGSVPGIERGRPGVLQGTVAVATGNYDLQADWNAEDESSAGIQVQGRYSRASDKLQFSAKASESSWADLTIGDFTRTKELHIKLSQPQGLLQELMASDFLERIRDLQIDGEVAGPMEKLACRLLILNERTASRLKLNGAFRMPSKSSLSFDGDISLRQGSAPPLEGSVSLKLDQSVLSLRNLQLDSAITAFGELNLETGEIGPTQLRIAGWPLERGLQIFAPDIASKWEMVLDGRLEFYGDVHNPRADLDLYASQGHYREQGNFWAVISAQLDSLKINLNECNIGQGVVSLAQVQGWADLENKTLDLYLRSNLADASDLMDLFGRNALQLHGPMNARADIRGAWRQPESRVYLTIGRGSIYRIPFDLVDVEALQDSSTDYTLVLKKFSLKQLPDLELKGEGTLPWNHRALDLQLTLQGNILKMLHQIEKGIQASSGQSEFTLRITQRDGKLRLSGGSLQLSGGKLDLPEVVKQIRDLSARAHFDQNRLVIEDISGEIDGQRFNISNYFTADTSNGDLQHLYFSGADVDMGVVSVRSHGRGIHAHIPSLMPKGRESYISLLGKDGRGNFSISGQIESPLMRGSITASNVEFTYPFPPGGKKPSRFVQGVLDVLNSARWDVQIVPERDNRYTHELKALESHTVLGDVSEILTTVDIDLNVDPAESRLNVVGSLKDNSFRFKGKLVSTRGSVEYLDFNFRVERFEAEFDEFDPLPMVQGRASTVYVDSMGYSRTIYATLYVADPVTGERKQRGRWGDFIFVLEDDQGSSQEQILAAMGYSPGTISQKVGSLGGTIVSGMVLRGFVRPIERRLEGILQMDIVRLQPTLAQNLFVSEVLGVAAEPMSQIGWGAYMLRQSQLTVGKYLTDDVFLSYTGLWKTGINAANERHFGFLHRWNLDYRIRPVSGNLILTFGYEYDSLERLKDRSVALRYSFVF